MQHVKHPEITNKPKPAPAMRLGSSPSLAMAVKLIADFYCTTPERIKLTAEPSTDAPTSSAAPTTGASSTSAE